MATLEEMFVNPAVCAQVSRLLDAPRGVILIAGDTGSGKSTGIFVLAGELRARGRTCSAIVVDPELQSALEQATGRADWDIRRIDGSPQAWHEALRAIEPGAIVVAEELDYRSARALVQAAKRGVCVLTVLGTPYVGVDAIYSLQNNGITTAEVLDHFSCVASQLLVPRLCPHCRVQVEIDAAEARSVEPGAMGPMQVWRETGCDRCEGRGVRGRLAVHEVLAIDEAAKPVLADYLDKGDLHNPLPDGHVSIQETARLLLREGKVGLGTYRRQITQNPILRMQHQWELERRQAGRIRDLFSRFVTHQVVDRMLADAHVQAIVDGERRWITCLFADVRGFTSLAEGMRADDTVNVAARLEAKAAPGEVLIGPRTAQAVAGRIRTIPMGPLALKGKAEAIEAFAVAGA